LFPFLLSGCADILTSVADAPASVEITPSEIVLNEGETSKLEVHVFGQAGQQLEARPESFTLQWQNSDSTVFSLDAEGTVTALAPGEAEVTVTVVSATTVGTGGIQIGGSKLSAKAKVKIRPVTTKLVIAGGQDQSAVAGARLADSLAVRAVDPKGNGVSGVQVDYAVASGAGQVSPVSVRTDKNGYARAAWTLGPAAGKQSVTVSLGGTAMLTFNATATEPSTPPPPSGDLVNECSKPGAGWIWCDDFEQDRLSKYFEYNNAGGNFVRAAGVGKDGSYGMRARWNAGQVSVGALHLAFGKSPDSYVRPVDGGTAKYREVYWRMFVRYPADWTGGGADKLSRAQILAGNWAQAMVGHVWSGYSASTRDYLIIDPASGTTEQGVLQTTTYNDQAHLRYLGAVQSKTPIFATANLGQWRCVEAHVRLNDAGQTNGTFDLWIDGKLEAQRTGLNWVGSYGDYGINTVYVENYWNNGAPKAQERYIDGFVVSTQPIGCGGAAPAPEPPPPPAAVVGSVTVLPSQAGLTVGQGVDVTAGVRDGQGNVMTGKSVTWSSSNAAVARVTGTGALTARIEGVAAGTATVTASVDGKSATVAVTVASQPVPPPSGGDPQPGASDRILFDTRTSLQQATSKAQADALFLYVSNEFSFTSNVDGKGTRAMRADYQARPGECWDSGSMLQAGLSAPYPKEVYFQYKILLGRTATGGGIGDLGRFQITNAECGNAGAKRFLVLRDVPDRGGAGRTDLLWPGPAPAIPRLAIDTRNWSLSQNRGSTFDPQTHVGEVMTWTLYFRAASSPSANDGIARVWVNGQLIIETTTGSFGPEGYHRFQLPATFRAPQFNQSEYYWDIVAWTPNR
jgi:hypothetical protein